MSPVKKTNKLINKGAFVIFNNPNCTLSIYFLSVRLKISTFAKN
jgi:hypothetical protein